MTQNVDAANNRWKVFLSVFRLSFYQFKLTYPVVRFPGVNPVDRVFKLVTRRLAFFDVLIRCVWKGYLTEVDTAFLPELGGDLFIVETFQKQMGQFICHQCSKLYMIQCVPCS